MLEFLLFQYVFLLFSQRECASLEAVRQREDFSKLFNMIVKTNAELDQDEIIKGRNG